MQQQNKMKNKLLLLLPILLISFAFVSASYGDYITNHSVGNVVSNPTGIAYDQVNNMYWILGGDLNTFNIYQFFGNNWTYTGLSYSSPSCITFDYYGNNFYFECATSNKIIETYMNGTTISNWLSTPLIRGGYIDGTYFFPIYNAGSLPKRYVYKYFLNNATYTGYRWLKTTWEDLTGDVNFLYPMQHDSTYVWQIPEYDLNLTAPTGRTFYPSAGDHSITQLKGITTDGQNFYILDNYWKAVFVYELNPSQQAPQIQGIRNLKDTDLLPQQNQTSITGKTINGNTNFSLSVFFNNLFQNIINWFKGVLHIK